MVTTARMHPAMQTSARSAPGARRPAKPGTHAGTTLATREITTRQLTLLVVQGTLVACLILGILATIWFFFGDALRTHLTPIAVSGGAAAPPGPGPTVFYRDRGDGSFTVMEIDGNGARLKGTIHRNDVPLLQADKVHEGWGQRKTQSDSRVNALGSAFR